MTEEPQKPQGRYKQWAPSTPEDVALSRKIFFGMMGTMAVLLLALIYGALR